MASLARSLGVASADGEGVSRVRMAHAWRRLSRWACGEQNVKRRPGTGVLLDLCAMLKSLFAALSILHMLEPSQLMHCRDMQNPYSGSAEFGPSGAHVPGSWLLTACRPSLDLDNVVTAFKISIVLNQITFATTSFLTHVNPCNVLAKSAYRALFAYFLGTCSFVFGAGKIVLILVIPLLGHVRFPCAASASNFAASMCSDTQVEVPASLLGTDGPWVWSSCKQACSFSVPVECYILAVTFLVTWIYSLFMCDALLHRNEITVEERMEAAREEKLLRKAKRAEELAASAAANGRNPEDEEAPQQEDDDDSDSSDAEEEEWAKPPAFKTHESSFKQQQQQQLGTALLPVDADGSFRSDGSAASRAAAAAAAAAGGGVSDDAARSEYGALSSKAGGGRGRMSARSLARRAQAASSASDVLLGLDPVSSRALQLASGLSAQELVLAKIESDYRKGLAKELRERDMFYRLLRDSATLAKFVLTMVSLCLLIFNLSGGVIYCDHSPDPSADFIDEITPSVVQSSCNPAMGDMMPSFMFTVLGAAMAALFVAIVVVEKRVSLPEQSSWLGGALLGGVAVLFIAQLGLLFKIEHVPLEYPCSNIIPGAAPQWINGTYVPGFYNMTESGSCPHLSVSITGTSPQSGQPAPVVQVQCDERCYLSLGMTVYTLFAGLVLSLVYMASLVMRYRQLALMFTHTQRQAANRMKRILTLGQGSSSGRGDAADEDDFEDDIDAPGAEGAHQKAAAPVPASAEAAAPGAGNDERARRLSAKELKRKQHTRDVLMAILDKY